MAVSGIKWVGDLQSVKDLGKILYYIGFGFKFFFFFVLVSDNKVMKGALCQACSHGHRRSEGRVWVTGRTTHSFWNRGVLHVV